MKLSLLATLLTVALALTPARAAGIGAEAAERTIVGAVRDALGRPLAGVNLELRSAADKTIARSATDRRGEFLFLKIPPGVYSILARGPGFKPAIEIISAAAANPKPITIAMESERELDLPLAAARLERARNSISPETGSSGYRFTDQNINQLPQGDNTPFNGVLIQAPGVSQDSYGQGQGQIHIHGLNGAAVSSTGLTGFFCPRR